MAARLQGGGIPRCRRAGVLARAAQGQSGRAPARQRRAQADPAGGPSRRGAGQLRADWSVDPFKLIEQDGYYYARGSSDDKYMAASFIANLIRYRQEGYKPDRDIIVALETDEEIFDQGWARHPVAAQESSRPDRRRIRAERRRRRRAEGRQADPQLDPDQREGLGELPARGQEQGGHSAVPRKDNAIYRLADGIDAAVEVHFPVHLNETTRAYFERTAQMDGGRGRHLHAVLSGQARSDVVAVVRLSSNPGLQRATTHHMRRDDAAGRSRRERAAAAGDRQGQLPGHARRADRRRSRRRSNRCSPTTRSR